MEHKSQKKVHKKVVFFPISFHISPKKSKFATVFEKKGKDVELSIHLVSYHIFTNIIYNNEKKSFAN